MATHLHHHSGLGRVPELNTTFGDLQLTKIGRALQVWQSFAKTSHTSVLHLCYKDPQKIGHAVRVDECLLLESHLRGGRERATPGAKGKFIKDACSVVHQEDH